MLSAGDYDAGAAERYGWINRALPAGELSEFVRSLALRIASFPAAGLFEKERPGAAALLKDRLELVAKKQNPNEPVVCLDEKPVTLPRRGEASLTGNARKRGSEGQRV
jgi:enoyl-CoA hydratase/carnithine racemase